VDGRHGLATVTARDRTAETVTTRLGLDADVCLVPLTMSIITKLRQLSEHLREDDRGWIEIRE
jgi:hypothetical protein